MKTRGILSVAGLAVSAWTSAQAPPMTPVLAVNTYTTSNQANSSVAIDSSGRFLITWMSLGQDGSTAGVFGRLYDDAGAPAGPDFQINTYTTSYQLDTRAAALEGGKFVVVWAGVSAEDPFGISGRLIDASGTPLGSDFPVNSHTTSTQANPAVAADGSGGFVVAWVSYDQDGDGRGIFARRFGGDGTLLSAEIPVNVATAGHQSHPAVASDAAGNFVVVWENENDGDGSGYGIVGRRFSSSGSPLSAEIVINAATAGSQYTPDVACDSTGNFVVVWGGIDAQGYWLDTWARSFDATGTPLSGDLLVNTNTAYSQDKARLARAPSGEFVVVWRDFLSSSVLAQRFDSNANRSGKVFALNTDLDADFPAVAMKSWGDFVATWSDDNPGDGFVWGVFARRGGFPDVQSMTVDSRPSAGTSNVNGILESGERVTVDPTWKNTSTEPLSLTGTASNLTGPAGPIYTIDDSTTDYGSIAPNSSADCFAATGDCLEISVSGARPAPHWDATLDETVPFGVTKTWILHVGESFPDVPLTHTFYPFIENLFHNRITGGCGGGYCPDKPVTRAQMAVFLLKAKHGAGFVPPPCEGVFPDVPCPGPFTDWVEELSAEAITGGCGGGNYCADSPVTRGQMAVFLLKAEHGSGFAPPPCSGIFQDVSCLYPFADWIEQLFAEQITGGCGGGNYCPGNPNTRGQMAVFLVKTFGLQLYGAD